MVKKCLRSLHYEEVRVPREFADKKLKFKFKKDFMNFKSRNVIIM